jgi:hypothetical protein
MRYKELMHLGKASYTADYPASHIWNWSHQLTDWVWLNRLLLWLILMLFNDAVSTSENETGEHDNELHVRFWE